MTTVKVSEFRNNLAGLTNKTAYNGERICVERNGKPVFAVVPVSDAQLLEQLEDKMDLEIAAKAVARGQFVSVDDLVKQLGL
ncbi:MAG: type II toxin-antitoxin system Phd/YefM family antitoxin [Planctomycetaceae bacterium]|nr:type II toxin-antitoxin system Phd/YefM family antitoxin [Planctomycetaceae bacterium]